MKKVITMLLAAVVMLAVTACDSERVNTTESGETSTDSQSDHNSTSGEAEKSSAAYQFSYEDACYEYFPSLECVSIDLKFRNISEGNVDEAVIILQSLDANGDVVESTHGGTGRLDAGQAGWATVQFSEYVSFDDFASKVESLKIMSYQVSLKNADGDNEPLTIADFDSPILLKISDIPEKD